MRTITRSTSRTPRAGKNTSGLIDATAAIGCDHLTFAPQNTGISARDQSVNTWKTEYVLWLGMGQKIRSGEWRAGRDPLPDSFSRSHYARSRNVKLIAYVYPDLAFSQSRGWLTPDGRHCSLAIAACRTG